SGPKGRGGPILKRVWLDIKLKAIEPAVFGGRRIIFEYIADFADPNAVLVRLRPGRLSAKIVHSDTLLMALLNHVSQVFRRFGIGGVNLAKKNDGNRVV